MDLQTYLKNAVDADRAAQLAKSNQLTLGEMISKCEVIAAKGYKLHDDSSPRVSFDFEYLHPTSLASWRGIYAELALGFTDSGLAPSLPDFLHELQQAVGREYPGWKGGDYTMSRHTPVWVANPGNAGNTAIIDVVDAEYEVILITAYREAYS